MSNKITEELGTASCIKSRENRHSVVSALTSIQARLKLYKNTPPNGLVIFAGDAVSDESNKEKKLLVDIEPLKPITFSSYLCDNRFHTDILKQTLVLDEKRFGFIIVDGKGSLFGSIQGNVRQVITKFQVDLPRKHGRGGQSSNRFANIRDEKRHNYLRKIAEVAAKTFIENDKVTVEGFILGGSADLKTQLAECDMFDPRLRAKILKFVDLSYGDEAGFNQAIELAADCLQGLKFFQEKALLGDFFKQIAKDTGLYCFGVGDTFKALEAGAVENLIVWEGLDVIRYTVVDKGQETVLHMKPEAMKKNLVSFVSFP